MSPENDLFFCTQHQVQFCTVCRYGNTGKHEDDTLPEISDTREFMDLGFGKRLKELE